MRKELLKLFFGLLTIIASFQIFRAQFVRHSYRFNNPFSTSDPGCGPDLVRKKAVDDCGTGTVPGMLTPDSFLLCKSRGTFYHRNLISTTTIPTNCNDNKDTITVMVNGASRLCWNL